MWAASNRNLAMIYPTGTGKTLTAVLAAVNSIDTSKLELQVLYVCATLEAAVQAHSLMRRIANFTGIKIGLIAKSENGEFD